MSAEPRPALRRVPVEMTDRAFWLMLRQAFLLAAKAIERRHLPNLSKREIERNARDVV